MQNALIAAGRCSLDLRGKDTVAGRVSWMQRTLETWQAGGKNETNRIDGQNGDL